MKSDKKRVAVFISGRGTNLKSLTDHARSYEVCGILSNKSDAPGLAFGRQFNIPTVAVDRKDVSSTGEQKERLYRAVRELKPDFIALAGYMQIIDPSFVAEYSGRIVNIHPSLLPVLKGLYGSNVHVQALARGLKEHGCTVHFVDSGVDTGPVIAQLCCRVEADDNLESLSQRVLCLEHRLYPWVLNALAEGGLSLVNNHISCSTEILSAAVDQGIRLPTSI